MRVLLWALLTCVPFLLAGGCQVASLSPLYTPETTVRDARFEGVWVTRRANQKPDEAYMAVLPGKDGAYRVEFRGPNGEGVPEEFKGKVPVFEAHLVRVGTWTFVDLELASESLEPLGEGALFVETKHFLYRIEFGDDRFSLSTLDPGALGRWIDDHPSELPRWVQSEAKPRPGGIPVRPAMVITASTEQLQRFFEAHAGEAGLWEPAEAYTKDQSLVPRADSEE